MCRNDAPSYFVLYKNNIFFLEEMNDGELKRERVTTYEYFTIIEYDLLC